MKKEILILLIILIFAAVLRLWQLGSVPQGVTHDEMGYIYNAYSIAKTGKNVHGEFLPFLTFLAEGFPFLPVPIYLGAPVFWLLDLSAFSGRLLDSILGVADIFLIYLLIKRLLNDNKIALLSALFLAISPWHILLSRSAYDPNFSFFFYLLGIVLYLLEIENKRLPIFSIASFFLAVFSYRGMNALFGGLIILLLWYGVSVLNIKKKQLIVFIFGIGIISSVFVFTAYKFADRGYIREATINTSKMQQDIDSWARDSEGPLLIKRIFLNKPTYVLQKWRENYLDSYSPSFLFLRGEPDKIRSIWSRGKLYILDIVFILLGSYFLLRKYQKRGLLIILLTAIAGLPGMVGGPIYTTRNFFMAATFPILSAAGVLFTTKLLNDTKARIISIVIISAIYSYLLGSFLFDYYGRFAFHSSEAWFKSVKDVSSFVMQNKTKYTSITVGTGSIGELIQYAFYAKLDPRRIQESIQTSKNTKNNSFTIDNITFTGACLRGKNNGLPIVEKNSSLLYIVHENCIKKNTPAERIKDYFGNTVWEIYSIK